MKVDLSRLESMGRTAVHCTSKEQAEMFMEAMWQQYPEKVQNAWRRGQTNWSKSREEKKSIYYLPRIVRKAGETMHCQSSDLGYHDGQEYQVVEFSDLICAYDLGEFSVVESDIKSLFGMR